MTNKPFDPTKPYRRRDGKPAKIVYTFKSGGYIVVEDSLELFYSVYESGRVYKYDSEPLTDKDLINIPEKIEGWCNIYRGGAGIELGTVYATKGDAKSMAAPHVVVASRYPSLKGRDFQMNKTTCLLEDNREITAVSFGYPDGFSVGNYGVTKIAIYGEPGEYCMIPWVAIYKGDVITHRIPAHLVMVGYKEDV